jgi:Ca2+ transporting ATPase
LTHTPVQEVLFVKGAPEAVVAASTAVLCNEDGSTVPMSDSLRKELLDQVVQFGGQDLRVMALALRAMPTGTKAVTVEAERSLTFVGLVGMLDPPRDEVQVGASERERERPTGTKAVTVEAERNVTFVGLVGIAVPTLMLIQGGGDGVQAAIETCRAAGIRVIVVTGDNKATAEAVCRRIGVLDAAAGESHSLTGWEFDKLSDAEQADAVQVLLKCPSLRGIPVC